MNEIETEAILSAILQLKGVLSADSSESSLIAENIGASRELTAIREAIWDLLEQRRIKRSALP